MKQLATQGAIAATSTSKNFSWHFCNSIFCVTVDMRRDAALCDPFFTIVCLSSRKFYKIAALLETRQYWRCDGVKIRQIV